MGLVQQWVWSAMVVTASGMMTPAMAISLADIEKSTKAIAPPRQTTAATANTQELETVSDDGRTDKSALALSRPSITETATTAQTEPPLLEPSLSHTTESATQPNWVEIYSESELGELTTAADDIELLSEIAPAPLSLQLREDETSPQAIAQTLPAPSRPQDFETPSSNDDRFLQPGEAEPEPFQPDEDDALDEPTEVPPAAGTAQPTPGNILVETLTVKGSSILSEAEINALAQPFVGQRVSEDSLQRLADAITEQYLEEGYITSRAILNPKTLNTGNIEIQVLEGGIEEIEVEGVQHLRESYIRDRIALGARTPLNTGALEDQLRLLRSNALIDNIEASLRSGTEPAKSILVVRVTEADRFRASTSLDNYSPPSVGSERFSVSAGLLNPTGLGDDISIGLKTTIPRGSDTFDLTYSVPLNAMDGTLQFRTSHNRNNVVQEPFSILDIRGNSHLYELSFRQPLKRTPREEFALSTGLTYQTGQTFTFAGGTPFGFGPEADGVTTTTVLKLGQDYIKRDPRGAWALRSQFSVGLDLFDPTINDGPTPDGRFVSWLGQVQRVQVINENNFLILSADMQLASEPLLSSQQFVIGGGQSVRGFRQNVRAGDGGFRFSVEDRMTLARDEAGRPEFILIPFVDLGWIWYDSDNPNKPTDQQNFIAGTGLGFIWSPVEGVNLRFDYAIPLVDLSDRTQNAQDDGIHFSVNVQI